MTLPAFALVGFIAAVSMWLIVRLFSARRSPIALAGGLLYSVVLSGLAYYSYVESHSVSWAVGYSLAAISFLALVSAQSLRSLTASRSNIA